MTITFNQIWTSSTGLLKRFDLVPPFRKAYLKFQEESFEMTEALFKLASNRRNRPYRQDAAEEIADVLVTVLNLAYSAGLTEEEIEQAVTAVCAKNDLKSDKTHVVENGFIKRIQQVAYISEGEA